MKQRILIAGIIILIAVVSTGMYVFTQRSPRITSQELASQNSSIHQVTIKNFAFSPNSITIPVGTAVTWANRDTVSHTATGNNKSFDTGVIPPNQSKTIIFQTQGTYHYHCMIHPHMTGTIIVQ